MFDFNDHYTLDELLALDNFMCYVRASAAESIDIAELRLDLNQMHRTLSRVINTKLDEAAEEWDVAHKNTTAYKAVVSEPVVSPVAPDMFGWVGDALDDLCAAGEATGNDR